jgi:[protein-PII] uridylyltransferase
VIDSGGRSSAGGGRSANSDRPALGTDASGPGDRTTDIVTRLREDRARLADTGPAPGRAWCEAWSAAVDTALVELAGDVPDTLRWCLAAVGGYGRGELCPGSDVDVLLLHDGGRHDDLEAVVRAVVYPLWDAGLKVGYAVRSRKEAVSAVDDLDNATALLDARSLAGDVELLRDVATGATKRLRRRPGRFLDALTVADDERRGRAGDAAEALEPDLKSGAGGLRDVQSLRWAAAVLLGSSGLDPLVSAGYLGAEDRGRLARAYERLLAERVATHLASGRGNDVLSFEVQEEVAERLGHVDGADDRDTAPHRLLSAHFLAARTIDHVHERAWRLISADATAGRRRRRPAQAAIDGFGIVDGVLRVDEAEAASPDLPARLFHALARSGAVLERRTATSLRRVSETRPETWQWDDAARHRFLSVLWRGRSALVPLAEIDDAGMLAALLPEWQPLRGRAQRNPFHRYSLDRHAWHAAAEMGELVRSEPWAARAFERVADRDALMLGALLHDVGKAYGEPHSETGVPVAVKICERMGASSSTAERVGRMVELHLLLPDVATRRDLSDPALVDSVAAEVADPDMLAALHLLAAADGLATGPSAWTSWKASLVASLVAKVAAVLDEKHPDEVGDGAVVTAEQAQELAEEMGATPDAVRDHLARLPQRYASVVAPRAVVRHALMAAGPLSPTEVRTRVTPGPERDEADGVDASAGELAAYDELDVVALDTPGLFAKVAGVLALNGGSIVGASAFTRDDGAAVDTFTVVRPSGAPASWWARVEGDLVDAVAGKLALRARVARRARQEQRRLQRLPEVDTGVHVSSDESGSASVLEVRTQDRVGVLFAIADALAELELDIVVARIQTLGHEVVDVFTVRDGAGHPLDADHASEVELAVGSALDALGSPGSS